MGYRTSVEFWETVRLDKYPSWINSWTGVIRDVRVLIARDSVPALSFQFFRCQKFYPVLTLMVIGQDRPILLEDSSLRQTSGLHRL